MELANDFMYSIYENSVNKLLREDVGIVSRKE